MLKKYKIPILSTALQGIFAVVGAVLTTTGVAETLKKGTKKIAHLGSIIEKSGQTIKKIAKTMGGITKYPTKTLAAIIGLFGSLTKETALKPEILGLLVAVLLTVYIIKRNGRRG